MSGRSARNYYTDQQLRDDAKYWRRKEDTWRLRARAEWTPDLSLRNANTAKLNAQASERILRQREIEIQSTGIVPNRSNHD